MTSYILHSFDYQMKKITLIWQPSAFDTKYHTKTKKIEIIIFFKKDIWHSHFIDLIEEWKRDF